VLSKFFKKVNKINAVGNSHCHFFSGSHPGDTLGGKKDKYFISYSLGPIIAYNFYENHLSKIYDIISSRKIKVTSADYILLVVGEVDCRWHLPKTSSKKEIPIESMVDECIQRFFRAVLDLNKHHKVITWGGHPSTNAAHSENPESPIFGDVLSRNKTSLLWDSLLGEKSAKHGIPHVSILKELLNADGTTKMEYYQDYCHLKTEPLINMVIQKFKMQNLIS